MVRTGVQQISVVGDQQKALLLPKILRHANFRRQIEMIGRLVYQKEIPLPQKHRRQQRLGLFSARKAGKRPIQRRIGNAQQGQLFGDPPFFRAAQCRQGIHRQRLAVGQGTREIIYFRGTGNRPRIFALEFAVQQFEQSGFPPPVPADKARFPAGIQ